MTNNNFLGIPVEGDITRGDKRVPQKPITELEPLMRAVLNDPTMKAFGWTQYTPYFNDGDPCVFSVGSPWFLTVNDPDPDEVDDEYQYEIGYVGHPTLGKQDYEWDNPRDWENRRKVYGPYEGEHPASYMACAALADAIDSGAFEDVLLEAFGDHAQVTVRSTGISVDSYSHD